MGIKINQLVGLAVALAGGVSATEAAADNLTITGAGEPVATSAPLNGTPGNVIIDTTGSIALDAGETGITVDSSNDVLIRSGGRITSEDDNSTTGILILGGNTGTITNSGAIALTETYVLDDDDADGNLDGAWALGTARNGIWLQAGPAFIGDVISDGPITIEGNQSAGIRLDALLNAGGPLDGSLTTTGLISVTGDQSFGVIINGGLAGDALIRSAITVRGADSSAVVVNGDIGGALRINNTINVSGYHSVTAPADQSTLDNPDDLLQSGAAVVVRANVAGGVIIEGVGVEDDEDDDADGVTETAGDTDDDAAASISIFGEQPALLIEGDGSAIVLGTVGHGLNVRGAVSARGVYDGFDATAIRLEGVAGGSVGTTLGVVIDSSVNAVATGSAIDGDATAYGVFVGNAVDIPTLLVRGDLASVVVTDVIDTAYAVYLDTGAAADVLENYGTISARSIGETGNATAIFDEASSLTQIINSGSIIAEIIATDDDVTDDTPPPPISREAIAIDLRNAVGPVIITQQIRNIDVDPEADPFTDDDAVDDVPDPPFISIQGDIYLGAGADQLLVRTGTITGDLFFGGGVDLLEIDNGAVFTGRIDDSDGTLAINVIDGALTHTGGLTNIQSATFGADATLTVAASEIAMGGSYINAAGAVTFDADAVIIPVVPAGLTENAAYEFLNAAGGLTVDLAASSNVLGAVEGEGVAFLYNVAISRVNAAAVDGAANALEVSFELKDATELGLTQNQSQAYLELLNALRRDTGAEAAILSIDNESDFFDAYEDLMPSYSSAAAELATTAIQQAQGATGNRLAATRLHDLDEVSVWAQEIGYAVTRTPATSNGQEFSGHGFGVAVGIDGPLDNGGLFGLSASFIASEVEEEGRPEGEIAASFGQLNAYYGAAMGPIDLDFVAGLGVGKMSSQRFVEIGDTFSALSEADWMSYEGHGSVRASAPMRLADWMIITPQAALTYVVLNEEGYTEEGGGAAIDYEVDSITSQRLWGDVGVEFSARLQMRGNTIIAPRIFAGYRANLIDEEAERTVRFVSGATPFTLTDEGYGDGAPLLGIGVDATNGYSTFTVGYEGEFGDQIERHSLNASIRFRF